MPSAGRGPVCIDKLSIVFDLCTEARDAARDHLIHAATWHRGLGIPLEDKIYDHYELAYWLPLANDQRALVQFCPRSLEIAFLRVEWNPHLAGHQSTYIIAEFLARSIDDFASIWLAARVTRADIAFNVIRGDVTDMIVFSRNSHASYARYPPTGKTTGHVVGKRGSKRRFSVYDIIEKCRALGIGPPRYRRKDVIPIRLVRVEVATIRPGLLNAFDAAENPFEGLHIVSARKARCLRDDRKWHTFVALCKEHSVSDALLLPGVNYLERSASIILSGAVEQDH